MHGKEPPTLTSAIGKFYKGDNPTPAQIFDAAKSYADLAASNTLFMRRQRAMKLNKRGLKRSYKIGNRVKIYHLLQQQRSSGANVKRSTPSHGAGRAK